MCSRYSKLSSKSRATSGGPHATDVGGDDGHRRAPHPAQNPAQDPIDDPPHQPSPVPSAATHPQTRACNAEPSTLTCFEQSKRPSPPASPHPSTTRSAKNSGDTQGWHCAASSTFKPSPAPSACGHLTRCVPTPTPMLVTPGVDGTHVEPSYPYLPHGSCNCSRCGESAREEKVSAAPELCGRALGWSSMHAVHSTYHFGCPATMERRYSQSSSSPESSSESSIGNHSMCRLWAAVVLRSACTSAAVTG